MIQDLQPQTYIMIFIFAGLFWAGLMAVGVALWIGFMRLTHPEPKPTQWREDWEQIERNLSK